MNSIAQHPRKFTRNDFAAAVNRLLDENPNFITELGSFEEVEEYLQSWWLARFVRRVAEEVDTGVTSDENRELVLRWVLDALDNREVWFSVDREILLDGAIELWDKPQFAMGRDPVISAAHRAWERMGEAQPPGHYRQGRRELACFLWWLLKELPEANPGTGLKFLSHQQAADAGVSLGLLDAGEHSKKTAGRMLAMLEKNGAIEVVRKGEIGVATRYRILV